MSTKWEKEDIVKFNRLADEVGSRDQLQRINARLDMIAFIKKHGKEKCDAMWAHLNNGGKLEAGESK